LQAYWYKSKYMNTISKELLDELKQILEEDYKVKLSDKAVERIATFLVAYIKLLKEIDANS
jgi:hypothetical protein